MPAPVAIGWAYNEHETKHRARDTAVGAIEVDHARNAATHITASVAQWYSAFRADKGQVQLADWTYYM